MWRGLHASGFLNVWPLLAKDVYTEKQGAHKYTLDALPSTYEFFIKPGRGIEPGEEHLHCCICCRKKYCLFCPYSSEFDFVCEKPTY